MGEIHCDSYLRITHVTGPGCVLVSLRFGREPEEGPWITFRSAIEAHTEPMMDVDEYVREVREGIAEANRTHNTNLEVEEIEIVPDDSPTKGQVRYCAMKLAEHQINSEQDGADQPATAVESKAE